jgi:hypothetical protein
MGKNTQERQEFIISNLKVEIDSIAEKISEEAEVTDLVEEVVG